jgi:signal peptidase I
MPLSGRRTGTTAATRALTPVSARKLLGAAVLSLCLVAGWLAFAPTALGGPTTYVVTDGTSMLPTFHADGLVITHTASSYRIGEVAAYHNKDLGIVVMHRIVARDGNRYVLKGDNNSFLDAYHPTRADFVGTEWAYVPKAGSVLQFLRSPAAFAAIMALLGMFAASAYVPRRSRRRRRHHA